MPSVSNYQTALEGVLVTQISAAATTATVKVKEINGVTPTWLTTAHRLTIIQKSRTVTKVEVVDVAAGTTQSGSTVTLGTLTRGLPLDGTGFTGTGTAQVFSSGAKVIVTWDAQAGRQTMFKDVVNTITGSGAIRSTSTTTPILRLNNVTTAQRNAMSPANGDLVYDTDLGVNYQYIGGAWVAVGDTGTSNASTTEAGKVEEATVAELGAGTAVGATGARLFVNPSSAVKTSSGAGDENKLAVLNASGQLADGFLGTGTPSSSTFLRGDRTWSTPAFELFGTGSDGATNWTTSTNLDPSTEKQYTTSTLDAGQTLSVSSVNTPLIIHNTGSVTINGTVDLNGKGGASGAGTTGAGTGSNGTAGNSKVSGWTNGAGTGANNASSPGGGGAGASWDADGGAAATNGDEGTPGTKLDSDKYAFLASIMRGVVCGGGGGGGSCQTNGNAGAGGAGGGAMVWLIGGNLTLGASSIVRANGDNGTAGSATTTGTAGGGGGGGGGMVIIFVAGSITNGGVTLSATGGTGGASHASGSPNNNQKGGDGAAGRVIIYSLSTGTLITA